MKGIWKMLTGQGEKEYREDNRRFKEQIPDSYPDWMSEPERAKTHPAYLNNEFANRKQGFDYRRAHKMHGPQSKAEHRALAEHQKAMNPDGSWVEDEEPRRRSIWDWLLP